MRRLWTRCTRLAQLSAHRGQIELPTSVILLRDTARRSYTDMGSDSSRSHHTQDAPRRFPDATQSAQRKEASHHTDSTGNAAPPVSSAGVSEGRSHSSVKIKNHLNAPVSVQPIRNFADIAEDLPKWLNQGIANMGHKTPTLVQSYSIPLLLEAKDMVGIAPTGSGKTVAFAIPALSTINLQTDIRRRGRAEPSVLVLCPTRELTQQTKQVFLTLSGHTVSTRAAFGGQDRDTQREHLSHGCEVLVATPGRLCDFIESGDVSIEHVNFFVLDEADRMLELGFAPQLKVIVNALNKTPKQRRVTMMWSATWSSVVEQLASGMLDKAKRLTVEVEQQNKLNRNILQVLHAVEDESARIRKLVELYTSTQIETRNKVIIFANHKETTETVANEMVTALRIDNHQLVQPLHGGMKQARRDAIMKKYRTGEIRVLVATDVAARGLDVPDIEHVVNYDLPTETDRFVHRVGRTGRAGRKGIAHTFFTPQQAAYGSELTRFLSANGICIPPDVSQIIGRGRFGSSPRVFKRYSDISVTTGAENVHDDWRRERPHRHHHESGGERGLKQRPLRTFTMKRDVPTNPEV